MNDSPYTALPPLPILLEIAGETLEITPLKLGELPAITRALRPIAAQLSVEPDWLALLDEHGDALIEALSLMCRRPREWLAALALDEALQLAEALFASNADFFIQRLLPSLLRVSQRLRTLMPSPTTSSAS